MDIAIIGAGYVGLVTGTCLAEMGHHVVILDINAAKIEGLRHGVLPIYEPGLAEMLQRNVQCQRLSFTTDYSLAIAHGYICFIAVDTPPTPEGQADLTFITKAATALAEQLSEYRIIVNKSTVPVGTAATVQQTINTVLQKRNIHIEFDVVSNPEFLKEGDAIADCMKPDRVILGVDHPRAEAAMRELYAPFMLSHDRLLVMDTASAEMVKYAANVMLATRISLMNELAGICEDVGADIDKVRRGIGSDQRIGYKFLYPGIGFGGSCLPKDLAALRAQAAAHKRSTPLLDAVQAVNSTQKQCLWGKIVKYYGSAENIVGRNFAILGLAFKPNTDDMREAPSLVLIQQLLQAGATVQLYDPIAMEQAKRMLPDIPSITWCHNELAAAQNADAIILVTEWKQFRLLDFSAIKEAMLGTAFFDGRNQYSPERMAELGFDYFSIGRQPSYATNNILQQLHTEC
jgi:UDPglucose 6-dehydrogenase